MQYVIAGVGGADAIEDYAPEKARRRVEDWLASTAASRRAGISDEEWELRVALGVAGGR